MGVGGIKRDDELSRARWLALYESERANQTDRLLKKQAQAYLREADKAGVRFTLDYDEKSDLYTLGIKGEEGYVITTLKRLPTIIHGLYLLGAKARVHAWAIHRLRNKQYETQVKINKINKHKQDKQT